MKKFIAPIILLAATACGSSDSIEEDQAASSGSVEENSSDSDQQTESPSTVETTSSRSVDNSQVTTWNCEDPNDLGRFTFSIVIQNRYEWGWDGIYQTNPAGLLPYLTNEIWFNNNDKELMMGMDSDNNYGFVFNARSPGEIYYSMGNGGNQISCVPGSNNSGIKNNIQNDIPPDVDYN